MDLRVLMVTREYGRFIVGGAGVVTTKLVEHLRSLGVDVHVLSFGEPNYNTEFEHYIKPKSSILDESKRRTRFYEDLYLPVDLFHITNYAYKLIKSYDYDIVHVQEPYVGGPIKHSRKITTIHDTSYGEIFSLKKSGVAEPQQTKKLIFYSSIGYLMEYLSIVTSQIISVPSVYTKNELTKAYKVHEDKLVIIPNGIDLPTVWHEKEEARTRLGLPSDKVVIFTTARHISRKRIDMLLLSLCVLQREHEDTYRKIFVIIGGEGYLTPYLKEIAKRCDLKNVKFTGWIPSHMLPLYYRASDIYVFTSEHDYAPMAFLEACSHGIAIITTYACDYANMMRSYHDGIIVPPNDVIALKRAIHTLVNDEELRKRLSRNAIEFAKNFSWDKIAQKYLLLYDTILQGRWIQ